MNTGWSPSEAEPEDRYRLLADAMPQLVWITDGAGNELYSNSRLADYLELSEITEGERIWPRLLHPEDLDLTAECWARALEAGSGYECEHRLRMRDGSYRWHLSRATPALNAAGEVTTWFGTATDIDATKRAELNAQFLSDLAESIRRADSVATLEAEVVALVGEHLGASRCFFADVDVPEGLWWVREDYANPADQPRLVGKHPLSAHSGAMVKAVEEGRTIAVSDTAVDERTREAAETVYQPLGARAFIVVPLLRDGQWMGVLVAFAKHARDWTSREVALLEDVGERVWTAVERLRLHEDVRARERALQRSDGRFRTLFESMGQGFCIIEIVFDESGKPVDYAFLETNPMFSQHTGLSNVVGRRVREVAPDLEDGWFEFYGSVAKSGQPGHLVEQGTVEGERWFDVYAFPIEDPTLHRVAIFFSDVTERRRAEDALREADRRKDEFLATLAHELRNPLAPLRTGIELLRMPSISPPVVERTLKIMDRQLTQLVRLVDDLLDVSRITLDKLELRIERVRLQDVVASAVESCRSLIDAAGHTLKVEVPEAPLLIDADFTRLAQVCANLLNNAIRYTPPGGRIVVQAVADGDDVVMRVSDNGVGVEPALLSRIFDPFVQGESTKSRQSGGLGVGLTLVRRLVELHDGKVRASSAGPDRGSQFDVRLPRRRALPLAEQPKMHPSVHGASR